MTWLRSALIGSFKIGRKGTRFSALLMLMVLVGLAGWTAQSAERDARAATSGETPASPARLKPVRERAQQSRTPAVSGQLGWAINEVKCWPAHA